MRFLIFLSKVFRVLLFFFIVYLINDFITNSEAYKTICLYNKIIEVKKLQKEISLKTSFYVDSLNSTLKILDSLKSQLEAPDYIRFKIWEKSDIKIPNRFPDKFVNKIWNLAKERGIPIEILTRLIYQESKFIEHARSPVGATGYMQLMPHTYRQYDSYILKGMDNPEKNLVIGINYLAYLHEFWKVNKPELPEKEIWELSLASYNAGPTRVLNSGSVIPDIKETKDYVKFIMNINENEMKVEVKKKGYISPEKKHKK